nr:MAG TPA: hypothetical protein [Caudoviricetes sp.]
MIVCCFIIALDLLNILAREVVYLFLLIRIVSL